MSRVTLIDVPTGQYLNAAELVAGYKSGCSGNDIHGREFSMLSHKTKGGNIIVQYYEEYKPREDLNK